VALPRRPGGPLGGSGCLPRGRRAPDRFDAAAQEFDHGEGGQRSGPDRGAGGPPRPLPGRARVLGGERQVAAVDPHPGQVLMGRGSDPGVLLCLLQGLLAAPLDAGRIELADRGLVQGDAGVVTAGTRRGDRLFQQRRRAGCVAGVEVVLGCLEAASEEPAPSSGGVSFRASSSSSSAASRGPPPRACRPASSSPA
jgi:hypothetical protein